METRKYIKLIIVLLSQNIAFSQTGGQHIFQFLELSPSARITATGGNGIINYTLLPNNITNTTGIFPTLLAGTYTINVVMKKCIPHYLPIIKIILMG